MVRVRCSYFDEMLPSCNVNRIVMYHKVCKEFSCQKITIVEGKFYYSALVKKIMRTHVNVSASTNLCLFPPQLSVRKTFNTLEQEGQSR